MVKTRLCIVTHTFLPHVGGIEIVTNEQSKRLIQQNYAPTIITNRIDTPLEYRVDGVPVHCYESLNTGFRLGIPYSIPKIGSFPTFFKTIKDSQIIHAHGHPYLTSLFAGELAVARKKPFVLTQHNTFIDYGNLFNRIEEINDISVGKRNLQNADKIIAISNATRDYVLKLGAKPSKVKVIYNGVDLKKFRPIEDEKQKMRKKLGIPPDAFVVLTVRRLVYKNGIDTLLDCAKVALKKNFKIVFVVVGKGPDLEAVRSQVAAFGMSTNFKLPGFVSDADLSSYYNLADIFILPSKSGEGLPLVALEAMACSLPVIATKVGGIEEIPVSEFGKLVPPNEPDQLAAAVLEYAKSGFSRKDELRAKIEERYSWDANVEQLKKIYEELI